jgi:hypothetical protein
VTALTSYRHKLQHHVSSTSSPSSDLPKQTSLQIVCSTSHPLTRLCKSLSIRSPTLFYSSVMMFECQFEFVIPGWAAGLCPSVLHLPWSFSIITNSPHSYHLNTLPLLLRTPWRFCWFHMTLV